MSADVAAVILAGGFSSRMGEFKPLLRLGGQTLLERCVGLFRQTGVERLLAVTGHRAEEIRPYLERLDVTEAYNPRHAEGMFTSVLAGVRALPPDLKAFFLLPVDTPLIRPATVAALLHAWQKDGHKMGILHPALLGHRGHPPLTGVGHVPAIQSWDGGMGLGGYFAHFEARCPAQVRTVEVPDAMILFDLDHPTDFQTASARFDRLDTPNIDECLALLAINGASPELRAHSLGVAMAGLRLAAALERAGCPLDLDRVTAAGLLHDVAKGRPDHALAGADLLRRAGFSGVAGAVAGHMDLAEAPEEPNGPIARGKPQGLDAPYGARNGMTECEVLYLADKYVRGAAVVPLEDRFSAKERSFKGDAQALAALDARRKNTFALRSRMEAMLGEPPEAVLLKPSRTEQEGRLDALFAAPR